MRFMIDALRSFRLTASDNSVVIASTCANPGPIPPPVVGLAPPLASPINITRSAYGRRTIPEGMGPQNRAISLMALNRPAWTGWSKRAS